MNTDFNFYGMPGASNDAAGELLSLCNGAKKAVAVNIAFGMSTYTYIRPNVETADGSVSYFAMVLTVAGKYCRDFERLADMFDHIFRHKVAGSLLAVIPTGGCRYLVDSAADCAPLLKDLKIYSIANITDLEGVFTDIDSTLIPVAQAPEPAYFNIDDAGSPSFHNTVYNTANVFVSQDYAQLSSVTDQVPNEMRELAERFEAPLNELLSLMRQAGNREPASGVRPHSHVSEGEHHHHHHHSHESYHKKEMKSLKTAFYAVTSGLAVLMLLFLLLTIRKSGTARSYEEENNTLNLQINELKDRYEALSNDFALLNRSEPGIINPAYPNAVIEVFDVSNGTKVGPAEPLIEGRSYKATITGCETLGEWRGDGFQFSDSRSLETSVITNRVSDNARFSYYVNGSLVQTRAFTVKRYE